MSPWYVRLFVRLFKVDDSKKKIFKFRPDVIFSASYSAKNKRQLAWATAQNLRKAIWFQERICSHPPIVFASCSHPFPGAAEAERRLKVKMLRGARYIDAGPMVNSVTEMQAMKAALEARGIVPRKILIVTCELHSRSEAFLATALFPGVEVSVACNTHEIEVEDDHPTKDQRTWPRWIVMSAIRLFAFCSVAAIPSLLPVSVQGMALDYLAKVKHD